MVTKYSLYQIQAAEDLAFDPKGYSRFKFGDSLIAEQYGNELAEGFIASQLESTYNGQQLVVVPSPYSFIPTATYAMKTYFVYRINRWLAENGHPVVHETKVHRSITYKEDYGELDAEARMALIGNDSFHIDKAFLKGKQLIFLDDIRITGSHERMILKMVDEYQLDNDLFMLYFAELTGVGIHPNFENYLNYYEIKSIFDLDNIVNSGNFNINTRFVKYVLSYDSVAFGLFIGEQSRAFCQLLYHMAIGNTYHTIDAYQTNLSLLKNILFHNNYKQVLYGD